MNGYNMNKEDNINKDKKALIDLIKWYRDEYHKKDFGHTEMIEILEKTEDEEVIESYERLVDDWLDY